MDLSIVIPAWNEAAKIVRDVEEAAAFAVAQGLECEILVADDGSSDSTVLEAEGVRLPSGKVTCRVLTLPHRGKGYAVREGIAATTGDIVMFADSGATVPYEQALRGIDVVRNGEGDIANASRRMVGSCIVYRQPLRRRLSGAFFRFLVRLWFDVPYRFTDTQCGFKVYRGSVARDVYAACTTDGFVFDVEVVVRAGWKGYRIREFPVDWTCDLDSRLSLRGQSAQIMRELLELRGRLRSATPQS